METAGPSISLSRGYGNVDGVRHDAEFQAAFVTHYERILRVLLRLTGNRGDAEDLASEVFLRLSRQSSSWLLHNNVGGWLYRTATHAGIDFLRSRKRRFMQEQAAVWQADAASPLAEAIRAEEAESVRSALACLKQERAQILLLRASGASYGEIAEVLEVSVGSVGTLLSRAEDEFRKRYVRTQARKETR